MRELVGNCAVCGKAVHCEDGFLNGIVQDNGTVVCFDCDEKKEEAGQED